MDSNCCRNGVPFIQHCFGIISFQALPDGSVYSKLAVPPEGQLKHCRLKFPTLLWMGVFSWSPKGLSCAHGCQPFTSLARMFRIWRRQ